MRSRPVTTLSQQTNKFASSTKFSAVIRSSLGGDVLPSRAEFPRKFESHDFNDSPYHALRVAEDERLDRFWDVAEEARYEHLIQEMFWAGLEDGDNTGDTELYVLGPIGCGKSTFVDHYLRHFCPCDGDHRLEFDKKLVVHIDLRGESYHKDASENFYNAIIKAVKVGCAENNVSIPQLVDSVILPADELTSSHENVANIFLDGQPKKFTFYPNASTDFLGTRVFMRGNVSGERLGEICALQKA